ncbi:DUF3592 domain-containing protein [Micromonospora sp. NPDC048871]|uniref:DUF3592 domain-containing protein n=1 Tax=unclassified Micromonospora TaxID=2617518 RepID=UPI002E11DF47|nr:DUF3592 domain-containing protein [Micromonospora sp. NBC_01739]
MGWRERRKPRRLRSRWLPGYWLRHPLTGIVLLVAMVVVIVSLEGRSIHRTHRLDTHGVQAEATVREVHALGRNSYVLVAFTTAEGRQVVAEVTDYRWVPGPKVGDIATVRYDPADPRRNVRDVRIDDGYLEPVVIIAVTVMFGVVGGVLLWWTRSMWRQNAEDWRSGRHFA